MKKYIPAIAILFWLGCFICGLTIAPYVPHVQADGWFFAAPPAGGSCTTQEDATAAADANTLSIGQYTSNLWVCTKLTVDSTYTACSVKINFAQTLTPASTITLYIYDDNSGSPGSLVGSGSSAINESTIIANGNTYTFSVNASLSTGTYWVVMKRGAVDASNYFQWRNKSGYVANCSGVSSTGAASSWTMTYHYQNEYVVYK